VLQNFRTPKGDDLLALAVEDGLSPRISFEGWLPEIPEGNIEAATNRTVAAVYNRSSLAFFIVVIHKPVGQSSCQTINVSLVDRKG